MAKARRHRDTTLPRQADELARLKMIQGPDAGVVFVLTGERVVMGRGEENDVMISDLKASRRHIELAQTPTGWTLKDLGSANGVVLNGQNTRAALLKSGDVIQLGETLFEFHRSDTATMVLTAPVRSAEQVLADQAAFEAQRVRVRALAGVKSKGPSASEARAIPMPGQAAGDAEGLLKNKRVLLYGALGLAAYFFIFEEQTQAPAKKVQQKKERDLAAYVPPAESASAAARTADVFFKDGFREYTSKNHLRARLQFETALQVYPGHPLARLYLEKSNQALESNIKFHLESGKKALSFGRYKQAKAHFESVMRSLHRDQNNPAYSEAREQLQKTIREMKGDG